MLSSPVRLRLTTDGCFDRAAGYHRLWIWVLPSLRQVFVDDSGLLITDLRANLSPISEITDDRCYDAAGHISSAQTAWL